MTQPEKSAVVAMQEPKQMTLATSGFDPKKGSLTSQMLFDPGLNERVNGMIQMLANSPTAPKHARGNYSLMHWVVDMHLSTQIPPMALINGTFDPGGGIIGMTAQLCLTILQGTGSIVGEPEWEQIGDWSKVRGKHKIIETNKDGRKSKFAVPTYTEKDEEGLGLRVTIQWADQEEPVTYPRSLDEDGNPDAYWMRDCYPRNSTLWATNPLQQMKNYCLRLMSRTARPAVLNGMSVASGDEIYQGFENAKVIVPTTPEENLDDLANLKDDGEDVSSEFVDEDGVVHDTAENSNLLDETPADHGKLMAWLSFENPAWKISKPKLEELLTKAMDNADSLDHLIQIVNNNSALIRDHLTKAARDRLKKVEERMAEADFTS